MMKLSATFLVIAVAVITLMTCVDGHRSMKWLNGHKSSVDIINWDIGQPLWVHCKSADDDLHLQKLQVKQDYHFEFRENFWLTTLFWCNFAWGPSGKNRQKMTVWNSKPHAPDMPFYCTKCVWRAQKGGMYIWNKVSLKYELWKKWNTDGPPAVDANVTDPAPWRRPASSASNGYEI